MFRLDPRVPALWIQARVRLQRSHFGLTCFYSSSRQIVIVELEVIAFWFVSARRARPGDGWLVGVGRAGQAAEIAAEFLRHFRAQRDEESGQHGQVAADHSGRDFSYSECS